MAEISERARILLKTLVEHHIRDGQPVGSSTLRQEAGLPVSAATIRNVMSDLEERGFLHSPHTSAGRVPTARGYRFFVDSLLQVNPAHRTSRRVYKGIARRHGLRLAGRTYLVTARQAFPVEYGPARPTPRAFVLELDLLPANRTCLEHHLHQPFPGRALTADNADDHRL